MENLVINSFLQQLINDNAISKKDLLHILKEAQRQQVSFITHLLKKQIVDSVYLAKLMAKEFNLPFLDLDTVDPFHLPSDLIEEKLLQKYQVLPLWRDKEKLGLAIVDPSQQIVIDDIRFHTELTPERILVEPEKLKCLLEKIIQKPNLEKKKTLKKKLAFNLKQLNSLTSNSKLNESIPLTHASEGDETAIIECVYELLRSAIDRGASDIHIEPHPNHLQVRFRIDGLLYLVVTFPLNLMQRITTRLKIMSQLDIAERRIPQDGRFQIPDSKNQNIDCRINTCPTLHGEKLVIRILDSNKMQLEINKLGMNKPQVNSFLHALRCPHGMVLVTGPTGSGKTITLYTALNFLNTSTLNISSVENPIEIVLPGINQININPKLGLNFANVLRAFLRQDPDVIMVGEMRDHETAEIGIKAAQTGHLVLSSLHTNGAVESLIRLTNMGIPSYNIASSIHLIIAQRLARRLCPHCKIKDELPENVLVELGFNCQEISSITLFSARGCTKCTEGYRGRTGIFEMLSITDDIKKLILKNYDVNTIESHAQNEGMQTLY
ncbi:MAG: ATPase, T2SS/T4P/T4SS family, partial [Rickettsiella sp.]|nr:ATPase, T2SS/T4P/T4SS family [Rickettsiella sp.]